MKRINSLSFIKILRMLKKKNTNLQPLSKHQKMKQDISSNLTGGHFLFPISLEVIFYKKIKQPQTVTIWIIWYNLSLLHWRHQVAVSFLKWIMQRKNDFCEVEKRWKKQRILVIGYDDFLSVAYMWQITK